jgi:hypothetical protein
VSEIVVPKSGLSPTERLALAQAAFREFHARCFWFMRPDAEIVEAEIPYLCQRLRADGVQRGFYLAAELCRQPALRAWFRCDSVRQPEKDQNPLLVQLENGEVLNFL